jgi:protein-disulfide isomerase
MTYRFIAIILLAAVATSAQSPAPSSGKAAPPAKAATHSSASNKPAPAATPESAAITRKIEKYLRNIYAWGPQFQVKIGAPADTPIPGLLHVPIEINFSGQTNSGEVLVSADGRYIVQGELSDMNADPFAPIRQKMRLDDAASDGPRDSRVVVVEYGDFQCPSCRQLQPVIKALRQTYPQVRFVFRDFPLTQIHAWAMTASLAGRCVLSQKPEAFWTYSDAIYESQDLIKPENAWDRMVDQAGNLGLDQDVFKACMAAPETKQLVDASIQEAIGLKVANTPTLFVNGRRLVGGDRESLEQYIRFELAAPERKPSPPSKP